MAPVERVADAASQFAKVIQILCPIIFGSTLGLSELYDHKSATQARTFDRAYRERVWSKRVLLTGIGLSLTLVIVLAAKDPSGLLDEKMWFWLGLVYLVLRRMKANRHIDHICRQFSKFAVKLPVLYYFGFPAPLEDYRLKNPPFALKKCSIGDGGENYPHKFVLGISYRREIRKGSGAERMLVKEAKPDPGSKWNGIERVTIKRTPGGYPRDLGPYELFTVGENNDQVQGNAIWFSHGSGVRDQCLLDFETMIELKRHHGREHVAVASAWAFLSLIFHPLRFSSAHVILRSLPAVSDTCLSVHMKFQPGWERLLQLARCYTQEMLGSTPETDAVLLAAIANEIISDNYKWLEEILPLTQAHWESNIDTIIRAAWSVQDPRDLLTHPSTPLLERVMQAGYAEKMQRKLLEKIQGVWGCREHFGRKVSPEDFVHLSSIVEHD